MVSLAALALAAAEEGAAKSGGLFQDTSFWVLLAFLLVIGVFWRFGVHKTITNGLDQRGQKIADELDEARRLREEAQELLAKFQRRQRDAENEATAIVEQAKKDAARLAEDARRKIEEQVERRTKAAEAKIARAEAQALSEVRSQAADLSIDAARHIIRQRMDGGAQTAFVDKAIAGLREKLN
ncbi:MAG: F0F1 ATP synthase subunit B [Pseudomonadota bacterium]